MEAASSVKPDKSRNMPLFRTVRELAESGYDALPDGFVSGRHLIYSSPASLSFNSPGAEGYGVKRAALCIPGSVLLLVSPGCCGRNTSGIDTLPEYHDRFFFLNMDESDIVTGRHLKKIPDAVELIINEVTLRKGSAPSVVMICITCVDALLGTDMERVCRRAEERCGLPVRPCYMYALTREGRRPPMVHIRQSLYSLLEKRKRRSTSINLLGNFGPLQPDCELYGIFRSMGIKHIREIATCRDYGEFLLMAEANFNVVLNPEALDAACDMEKRLGIPYIELKRLYQSDKVKNQYTALAGALGTSVDITVPEEQALSAIQAFKTYIKEHPRTGASGSSACPLRFAAGEFANADPFELALALIKYGFEVTEIFGTVSPDNFIYIKLLSALSPGTRVYSNLEPTMLCYNEGSAPAPDMVIGKDAAFYHPDTPGIEWREDVQPFGYAGIKLLFEKLLTAYREPSLSTYSFRQSVHRKVFAPARDNPPADSCSADAALPVNTADTASRGPDKAGAIIRTAGCTPPKGLRRYLPPFAPDASGASAVVSSLGCITVICDAGGCAGNICGFDEPRWLSERNAVFSAGLRDMDAILGRDDRLVAKLQKAARDIPAGFAVIIGTPVPSVIGTDYHALKRMSEKRLGIPTICIDTTGMGLYDSGAEKAYLELFKSFASVPVPGAGTICRRDNCTSSPIGIIGASPIDTGMKDARGFFSDALDYDSLFVYGLDGPYSFRNAGAAARNIVVSPSGLRAAIYLNKRFGIPYETDYPGARALLLKAIDNFVSRHYPGGLSGNDIGIGTGPAYESSGLPEDIFAGKSVLVIHQQVLAEAIAKEVSRYGALLVRTATWFMTVNIPGDSLESSTAGLREEADLLRLIDDMEPDIIIGDAAMEPLIRSAGHGRDIHIIDLPHFAVSGRMFDLHNDV